MSGIISRMTCTCPQILQMTGGLGGNKSESTQIDQNFSEVYARQKPDEGVK